MHRHFFLLQDEIDKIIAQINEEERKQKEVVIKSVSSPSCRSNFSFTAHPEKDELILFGGEYFNGQKVSIRQKVNNFQTTFSLS